MTKKELLKVLEQVNDSTEILIKHDRNVLPIVSAKQEAFTKFCGKLYVAEYAIYDDDFVGICIEV